MNGEQVAGLVYAVLSALCEAKRTGGTMGGIPNGHLYTALMDKVDLREWTGITDTLLRGGMIKQSNWLVTVTEKGEALHAKMTAVIEAHAAKQ